MEFNNIKKIIFLANIENKYAKICHYANLKEKYPSSVVALSGIVS